MQRFGSTTDITYYDYYAKAVAAHPGAVDNVWFATPYGFPTLETHRKTAEFYREQAKRFRALGVSVSLQLSNSIGHGQYNSRRDCTGLVYEGSPVEKMVGANGKTADYCFCFNGKHFKEYLLKEIALYAEALQPDCIWIDDDFRASNHDPADLGCFCDDCVRTFGEMYGASFTRETLLDAVVHGDIVWRERWIAFTRNNLASLMEDIGKTVHAVSPDTALGIQYCAHGAFTGYGYDFLFDAMYRSTGIKPMSRPGGGAYCDTNPCYFITKKVLLDYQNSMLPAYVECKAPEIENLPFVPFGKTAAGMAFETALYLASGNTDMTYSMLMQLNEHTEFYDENFAILAKERQYFEKLSDISKHTVPGGIRYYVSENMWRKKLRAEHTVGDLGYEPYAGAELLTYDAIPVHHEHTDDVLLLHPEMAAISTDDDMKALLAKNVITDGETLAILVKRGFDLGFTASHIEPNDKLRICEKMTKHPVNPSSLETWTSCFFANGRSEAFYLLPKADTVCRCEVLGQYVNATVLPPFTTDEAYPYGVAAAVITTPEGGRWAVFGYEPWKNIISLDVRDRLLNAAEYIGKPLPARLVTGMKAQLLPRVDKNGKTVSVSVASCEIGERTDVKLLIGNPVGTRFTLSGQVIGNETPRVEKTGDGYLVTIPRIPAWTVVTVEAQA